MNGRILVSKFLGAGVCLLPVFLSNRNDLVSVGYDGVVCSTGWRKKLGKFNEIRQVQSHS